MFQTGLRKTGISYVITKPLPGLRRAAARPIRPEESRANAHARCTSHAHAKHVAIRRGIAGRAASFAWRRHDAPDSGGAAGRTHWVEQPIYKGRRTEPDCLV